MYLAESAALSMDHWDWDDEYDPEPDCHYCGGDGFTESDDPLWDDDDYVTCPCCNGSGLQKDATFA